MYIVVGGSGYFGGYFIKNIIDRYPQEQIIATYNRAEGAIRDERVQWIKVNFANFGEIINFANMLNQRGEKLKVIYLSAYHHPDEVMKNFNYAWEINITALSCFLTKVENVETLYYSSTEMVYGESIDGHIFIEEDATKPINDYGRQKVLAEQLVLGKGYNVIRCSILMGKGVNGKEHFTDKIINSVREGKSMEMLDDTYRNMIDFNQAADLTLRMMNKYRSSQVGVVNVAGDDVITKYDVAKKIVAAEGLPTDCLKPICLTDNDFFAASRAQNLFLSNAKLKQLLGLDAVHIAF